MDMIMTELAAALPVDIMPGPDDPANVSLPQQPLHQCLFPGMRAGGALGGGRRLQEAGAAQWQMQCPQQCSAVVLKQQQHQLLPALPPSTCPAGAAPYNSFRRVTNPHSCELGGVLLLGSSGQNVDDMAKYTRRQSRWVWCVNIHT
jgi:DNA polymerase II small subunit/DNA polymerase delta subunit B